MVKDYSKMFEHLFTKSVNMSSTYKPVFLRALLDVGDLADSGKKLIGSEWLRQENGRLLVDLNFIAARFAKYYWDMEYSFHLRQAQGKSDAKINTLIKERAKFMKNPPTVARLASPDMADFRKKVIGSSLRMVLEHLPTDMPDLYRKEGSIIKCDADLIEYLHENKAELRDRLNGMTVKYLQKINPNVPVIFNKLDACAGYHEFHHLEKYVWDCISGQGLPISIISRYDGYNIAYDPNDQEYQDSPIWHTDDEIFNFVVSKMHIRTNDNDMVIKRLWQEITKEMESLQRQGVLIGWSNSKEQPVRVWRIDEEIFDKVASDKVKEEMDEGDYYCIGEERMVHVRKKNDAFRSRLVEYYQQCAFCGFDILRSMIGAHIVPYSKMRVEDPDNSMNPTNGLLLCRLCDYAFEHGYIMVEPSYKIIRSRYLDNYTTNAVQSWVRQIDTNLKLGEGRKYRPDPQYLKWKLEITPITN